MMKSLTVGYPDFHGRGVRHGDIAQNHVTRPVEATMIVNM